MTNSEAKNALFYRTPVVHRDIVYTHVKNIIYWVDDYNNLRVSLTLEDKNKHTTIQARVEDVSLYDNKNQIPAILP